MCGRVKIQLTPILRPEMFHLQPVSAGVCVCVLDLNCHARNNTQKKRRKTIKESKGRIVNGRGREMTRG